MSSYAFNAAIRAAARRRLDAPSRELDEPKYGDVGIGRGGGSAPARRATHERADQRPHPGQRAPRMRIHDRRRGQPRRGQPRRALALIVATRVNVDVVPKLARPAVVEHAIVAAVQANPSVSPPGRS
jgi:hypothetical protein